MSQRSIFEIQADLCKCMSSAIRIEIVHVLREGPKRVKEIAHITGHPQGTISRHIGVLRNGGVVTAHRHAQDVNYQIANVKIITVCDQIREILTEQLDQRSRMLNDWKK